ncbi:polyprenyl synthetase family protein [Rathayibacter tanaceti]|uniref:Hexaprenyl-diphosphate synthase large subunit ((2E,6E)-farnesyl-diphosphate specific) n=2 Tax=Rathayibacter tanaceti TaxID=1671680 RepID=A0A168G7T0_9MICO|nr:polyprenyl synthetase family protein [Rathayibacter tanaceti]KZX21856.1 Hexaprenyl-diphosphate synthase large subunit ((2E,6E)-farnesyl-diphosphate specific) [Rathayibacter tanaceti]QHC55287.1 polyprenyl synthetase family protein [Rathayibacter tanaceti]TCO36415.1 geranylgeranyl diphosphate synthase type I [Rathayibacter tanaceti]
MNHSSRLVDRVQLRIDEFLTGRLPILRSIGEDVSALGDLSRDFLSGGKRFRARFCEAGWNAVSSTPSDAHPSGSDPVARVGACLELFHAAALVHDDVIDNSDTRRGAPAAHLRFSALHSEGGWAGDGEEFGRSSAILLGDLLLVWSDEIFAEAEWSLEDRVSAARARSEFNLMRTEVTLGQYLDILEESAWGQHPEHEHLERAERVVVYKSAKYSIEAPLAIGGSLAGGDDAQIDALRRFGLPVGIAFQLRDDVLGVFGDPAVTGKPAGDDLREGKRTVLLGLARGACTATERAELDAVVGRSDANAAGIARAQEIVAGSGALELLEERISRQVEAALAVLSEAPLRPEGVLELRGLAEQVTVRSS